MGDYSKVGSHNNGGSRYFQFFGKSTAAKGADLALDEDGRSWDGLSKTGAVNRAPHVGLLIRKCIIFNISKLRRSSSVIIQDLMILKTSSEIAAVVDLFCQKPI